MTKRVTDKLNGLSDFLMSSNSLENIDQYFTQACFVICSPRSGSTFLMESLAACIDAYVCEKESHVVYRALGLSSQGGEWKSQLFDEVLKQKFKAAMYYWHDLHAMGQTAFIEKTPRNILAIPFLQQVCPAAQFVFLQRDAKQTLASMIEAWLVSAKNKQFVTYKAQQLPGWHLPYWCFVLLPNWRNYIGKSIVEVVVAQWVFMMNTLLSSLEHIESDKFLYVEYSQLLSHPQNVIMTVAKQLGANVLSGHNYKATVSKATVSLPDTDKWQRYEQQLSPFLKEIDLLESRLLKALNSKRH